MEKEQFIGYPHYPQWDLELDKACVERLCGLMVSKYTIKACGQLQIERTKR